MNKKDISVIVQGAVDKNETQKSLSSIRHHLPGAEIILSTWEGTDISGLAGLYDTAVFSKDPGAAIIERPGSDKIIYNNMNRQLLSTQEGLKKATNKYAMKLRSDLILTGGHFLNYFNQFPARTQNYNLFKHKILVAALFTRLTTSGQTSEKTHNANTPFHISDWWLFGLREDLNTYFLETPLAEEPDFTNYFNQKENIDKTSPYERSAHRFSPEQYFGYTCFARHFKDIHMEDAADHDEQLMEKYRECLVNNFIILEFEQSGIYLNKYFYSKNEKLHSKYMGLYHFYRYETEYKKICDNSYEINTDNTKIFKDEEYGYDLLRIHRHIFHLQNPSQKMLQKLEQLVWGIPVSAILFFLKHFRKIFLH